MNYGQETPIEMPHGNPTLIDHELAAERAAWTINAFTSLNSDA